MADRETIGRLQEYLRSVAATQYEAMPVPPFTLFVHPHSDVPYFNYAIPDRPLAVDSAASRAAVAAAVFALRDTCAARRRLTRLEFIAEYAPALPAVLESAQLHCESRLPLMVCTAETYRPVAPVAGLAFEMLDDAADAADFADFLTTQRQGFDPTTSPATIGEAEAELARLGRGRAWLARMDGHPVAAAFLMAPLAGVSELAGVSTLLSWRRRGIATALAAHVTAAALASGVGMVCLSAERGADGVYRRMGYTPVATALAYNAATPAV